MDIPDRDLNWNGCYNVRDLGGLPLVDGRRTMWRSLIRADQIGRLTEAGKQKLIDYGVRTVIDLRFPDEAAQEPTADFSGMRGAPDTISLPLKHATPQVRARLDQAQTRADLYRTLIDLLPENTLLTTRAIAAAEPDPLLFHCHSGKDRTGITAALLLSLAGVEEEAIAADFAATQARLWPLYQAQVAANGADENDPWAIPITEPQTMIDTLAHLQQAYGGTEAYLLQIGLTAEEIALLSARLIRER